MASNRTSPYLANTNRLPDVIAAIQAMATYKFYKLDFEGWADRISGDETTAEHWRSVFEEHPEFFRLDGAKEKASLVWRRQRQKLYSVDREQRITRDDYDQLTGAQKDRISRMPLNADEISTLISTATDLHTRAIEQRREYRWWIPLIAALFGSFLGALVGSLPKWVELFQ